MKVGCYGVVSTVFFLIDHNKAINGDNLKRTLRSIDSDSEAVVKILLIKDESKVRHKGILRDAIVCLEN